MSEPYYEQDGITIYHGDCRDVLPEVVADVLVTDPPYGVGLVTKTSDYRQSAAFDNGKSLQATTLYEDSPEYVRALICTAIQWHSGHGQGAHILWPSDDVRIPRTVGHRRRVHSQRRRAVFLGIPVHPPDPLLRI